MARPARDRGGANKAEEAEDAVGAGRTGPSRISPIRATKADQSMMRRARMEGRGIDRRRSHLVDQRRKVSAADCASRPRCRARSEHARCAAAAMRRRYRAGRSRPDRASPASPLGSVERAEPAVEFGGGRYQPFAGRRQHDSAPASSDATSVAAIGAMDRLVEDPRALAGQAFPTMAKAAMPQRRRASPASVTEDSASWTSSNTSVRSPISPSPASCFTTFRPCSRIRRHGRPRSSRLAEALRPHQPDLLVGIEFARISRCRAARLRARPRLRDGAQEGQIAGPDRAAFL